MRNFGIALAAALALSVPSAGAQDFRSIPTQELIASAAQMHPAGYFALADRLFRDGRREDAARWLYVGQIRYRFHLAANPGAPQSGDPALFASLMESVGRPINEYAGGNVDGWLAAIDAALAWDAANPNGFTSKSAHAGELAATRSGLVGLRRSLDSQRADIARTRAANGLENR